MSPFDGPAIPILSFSTLIVFLAEKMEDFARIFTYWRTLKALDWVAIFVLLTITLVTFVNVILFHSFIKSKPAGRKTVLGNFCWLI